MNLASLTAGTAADAHPPLYHYLLHFWLPLAGEGELAVRYPSVVFGTLTVALTFVLGRRLYGPRIGTLAAFLTALSPFYVYYAQEARMYALVLVLVLAAVYCLTRALGGKSIWWAAYVPLVSLALYSHYSALLFLFVSNLFLVPWLWLRRRSELPIWLAGQVAILLLYAPWVRVTWDRFVFSNAPGRGFGLGEIAQQTLSVFALGPTVEAYAAAPGDPVFAEGRTMVLLLCLGLAAIAGWGLRQRPRWSWFPSRRFLLAWLLVPMLVIYLAFLERRDFTARYLIAFSPPFFLLLAAGLGQLRRPLLFPALALVLGANVFALSNYYFDPKYARADFRSAVARLNAEAGADDQILLNAPFVFPAFDYYYHGPAPRHSIPERLPLEEEPTARRLAELTAGAARVWLFLWQDYATDPAQFVESWLGRRLFLVEELPFPGKIKLLRFEDEPATAYGARFGDLAELVDYRFADTVPSGGELEVELRWRCLQPAPVGHTVSVHLVNTPHQSWGQSDIVPQLCRWGAGSQIVDRRRLTILPGTPPGTYHLKLLVYQAETGELLSAPGPGQNHLLLGPVQVTPAAPGRLDITHPLDAVLGERVRLLGYRLDGEPRPGNTLRLTLFWKVLGSLREDFTVFTHLLDHGERVIAQQDSPPAAGEYPTSRWQAGDILRDQYELPLPTGLKAGIYQLEVGMYLPSSGQRLPVAQDGVVSPAHRVLLREVEIRP